MNIGQVMLTSSQH